MPSGECARASANSGLKCSYWMSAFPHKTQPKPQALRTARLMSSGMSLDRPYLFVGVDTVPGYTDHLTCPQWGHVPAGGNFPVSTIASGTSGREVTRVFSSAPGGPLGLDGGGTTIGLAHDS